jgi:hypothetical protein
VSPRLIDFDEGSTTHHLKSKGSHGKDSSCSWVRKDTSCNWARECGEQRTSRPRGKRRALKSREKERDGLQEGKGRDTKRHKVGNMFVGLRMNRAAAGAYRKNHLCTTFIF